MDLTKDDSERVPAMVFGAFCFGFALARGMRLGFKDLGEELLRNQFKFRDLFQDGAIGLICASALDAFT
jgi:hypothetical protein